MYGRMSLMGSESEVVIMKKIFALFIVLALVCSCVISVYAFTYGDVNCDSKINTKDAVLIAQYLAKWKVNITSEGLEAADVRKDGVINAKDAVLLAQYLAKWKVELGDGSSNPTPGPGPGIGDDQGGDNEFDAGELYPTP